MVYYGDYRNFVGGLPDKCVDLIVTDPPYLHNKGHGNSKVNGKFGIVSNSPLYDFSGKMLEDMNGFGETQTEEFLSLSRRVLKKMNLYAFCSENQLLYYLSWAKKNGFYSTTLVWEKPLFIMNRNKFSNNAEFIVRIYEHGGTELNKLQDSNLYRRVKHTETIRGKNKKHPTEKPIDLIKELLLVSSKENDLILDPFCGSGTTGVACRELKRQFVGCEKDYQYYEVSRNRINYLDILCLP